MFVIFPAAALIVAGAVAMLAPIDTSWVPRLAFATYVITTAVVGFAVFSALDGGILMLIAPVGRRLMRPRSSSFRLVRGSSRAGRT